MKRDHSLWIVCQKKEEDNNTGKVTAVAEGTAVITATTFNGTDDTSDDKTATCAVTVIKKDSIVKKVPEAKTLDFTGSAQALVTAGEAEGGTMQYALGTDAVTAPSDDLYTTSIPAATGAGTYYVWYKVVGDDNHSDTTPVSVTVMINKANATPATVTANNRTYDGAEKPLVTVTGKASGGEMQYAIGTKDAATQPYTTSIPAATGAGTYYVWYRVVGDENHRDFEPVALKASIDKADYPGEKTLTVLIDSKEAVTDTVTLPDTPDDAVYDTGVTISGNSAGLISRSRKGSCNQGIQGENCGNIFHEKRDSADHRGRGMCCYPVQDTYTCPEQDNSDPGGDGAQALGQDRLRKRQYHSG